MTPVKYYVVKRPSKTEEGVLKDVSHFPNEAEAKEFAESEFFNKSYECTGSVHCVSFNIYNTAAEAEENSTQKLVESALKKLSKREIAALGVEHLIKPQEPAELELAPEPQGPPEAPKE